ncbi:filamentous hemagglutinin N-terminal domain-containing protein [Paraburkholderia phenoliruptrix]|uniref:Filamentous hemagglutinin N-terminal domain-containing protein n=1 Tax=Paraburkholderia phenoliruptrix TaxID=252970 RepID=A0ABV3WKJ7_9BURK|nr:filamentous hemagglutinin N-terminal domain-containing protein [Paraburkholderia phenoliruptrix]MDR6393075.1 filamentous hemagglutinin family protein [Paraburkholderia phenoliruptrix]
MWLGERRVDRFKNAGHFLKCKSLGKERASRLCSFKLVIGLASTVAVATAHAAGIVPDGNTATAVTGPLGGRQTVNIASSLGGVSNNTYTSFNVSKAGVDLNNVGINARAIVNQVTSTNPSLIQGDITVLGPRANVILANPNGITIDGGSFVNAGHVVLSTGQVSFNDLVPAPGITQRNVVLTTNRGAITVGPGGLSGTLVNLDLIAKQLSLNGPVTNNFTTSTGGVRATIGDSTNSFDTSLSPSDNNHDWLISSTSPGSTSSSVAVDITSLGGLTGGRVQLIVTDKGAGVRNAGAIYASAGDVVVSALGDVSVIGGSVKAENNIQITTPGAFLLQGGQLSAANSATLSANGITLVDDTKGASTLTAQNGALQLTSSGDISNTGSLIQSGGATGEGGTVGGDVTLNATGSILNRSSVANLGIVFAANGQTSLSAQGNIVNENGRVLANGKTSVIAHGDISNIIDHTDGTNSGQPVAYSHTGGSFVFFTHGTSGFDVDYGTVAQPGQLAYIASTAGSVKVSGRNVINSGGLLQSNEGDISITAQQAFTNEAVFSGQASYARSCWIFCHASASSNVVPHGGTIQSGGNIAISAGTVARNIGGNVFAAGDIAVSAPTTYAQGVTGYSAITQDRGFKAFFGSTWAQIIASDVGGGFTANGSVSLVGSAIIDGGYINGRKGVSASSGITTVRAPMTTPVQLGQHLGMTTWWWH